MILISYLIQVFYKFLLSKSLFSMLNKLRYYLNAFILLENGKQLYLKRNTIVDDVFQFKFRGTKLIIFYNSLSKFGILIDAAEFLIYLKRFSSLDCLQKIEKFDERYNNILCATGAQTRFFAKVNSSAIQYIALQRNEM